MTDYFVDLSASNDGDGTSAAQAASPGAVGAWNNLTNGRFGTLSTGDKVWIRRTGSAAFATNQCAFNQGMGLTPVGFRYFIGWPVLGDTDYAARPASGVSAGWDSDSQVYAQFTSLNTSALPYDGAGCSLRRLKLSHNLSSNGSVAGRVVRAYEMRNCYALSLVTSNPNWSIIWGDTSTWTRSGTQVTTGGYYANCLFEGRGQTTVVNSNNPCDFIDCTFQRVVTFDSGTSVAFLGAGAFSRCTFVDNSTGNSAPVVKVDPNGALLPAGYPGPMLVGCTIDNSLATVNANYALYVNMRALIRNLIVLGTGIKVAAGCPPMHVSTFTQSVLGTYGIECANQCVLRVDDATFKTNTTSDVLLADECILFLYNVKFNIGTADTRVTSSGVRYAIYTMDEGSTLGAWKQYGPNGTITKNSSVARTGGEVFSLQFFQKEVLGSYYAPLETGGVPGLETLFVNLNSGANTITVFIAVRNWDGTLYPVDADTFWIEVDYMDGATGHVATASSKAQGALASDASTWTGDGSLTALKATLTVSPSQGQVAPVRVYFNKPSPASDAGRYAYVDPKVVIS